MTDETQKATIDTPLELMKYTAEVHSRAIKDNISSDFTLCKLEQQDKDGIANMTVNAYLAEEMMKRLKDRAITYEYNKDKQAWEIKEHTDGNIENKRKYKSKDVTIIDEYRGRVFDKYMRKATAVAVLNRNVTKNFLIEQMTGGRETEQPIETADLNQQINTKVKEIAGTDKKE